MSSTTMQTAQTQLPAVPLTIEGASVLHSMMRFRWTEWRKLTEPARAELALTLADAGRPEEAGAHLSLAREILAGGEDWRGLVGRIALALVYRRRARRQTCLETMKIAQLTLNSSKISPGDSSLAASTFTGMLATSNIGIASVKIAREAPRKATSGMSATLKRL